jgi:hypothetical protein
MQRGAIGVESGRSSVVVGSSGRDAVRGLLAGVVAAGGIAPAALAVPLPYEFTVRSSASGLDATLGAGTGTAGTLIGNYDEATNPAGTRTKPGLFGTFGATENVAVPVALGAQIAGPVRTAATGAFSMTIDAQAGAVALSGYSVDLLGGVSVSVPATITLDPENFRTRNPTSIFPGISITLPVGEVTVSRLRATQVGGGAPGLLTPLGNNRFEFTVVPVVSIEATFDFLGNPLTIPGVPAPLPLTGVVTLDGTAALVESVRPLEFSQALNPGVALPQFPLELPTLGGPASLLLDLTLDEISANLSGTQTLTADGVLVPAPGVAGVLALAGLLAARRRRG